MANERTYAILPCSALGESIAFYETLGFKRTCCIRETGGTFRFRLN